MEFNDCLQIRLVFLSRSDLWGGEKDGLGRVENAERREEGGGS